MAGIQGFLLGRPHPATLPPLECVQCRLGDDMQESRRIRWSGYRPRCTRWL